MHTYRVHLVAFLALLTLAACNHNPMSKLTLDNYNKITTGMSKAQVQQVLGPPTKTDMKDMIVFKKTTFRYEDGTRFAEITFKNDEVDGKQTNLDTQ
jgi:outer membrane protein assembly factor BamE (lipoprotein component of BamABCDE complex)